MARTRKKPSIELSAAPAPQNDVPFLSPELAAEFRRCCTMIGPEADASPPFVGSHSVLRSHFLVAEYFVRPGREMAAVGPKSPQLLQSAVSRQFVQFDGNTKWDDPIDIAATLFFGLVKNHPFHDANKRTALLTLLHQMQLMGRIPIAPQEEWEQLTVDLAEGALVKRASYKPFLDQPDPDVRFLGWYIRRNTRAENKREFFISYKQLERILTRFGFYFGTPKQNHIDIFQQRVERHGFLRLQKRAIEVRVATIGFRNWGEEVSQKDVRIVRRATGLTAENGYDSDVLFQGLDPMESLIAEYHEPLRRLAKR